MLLSLVDKIEALNLIERVLRLCEAYAVTGRALDEYTRRSVDLVVDVAEDCDGSDRCGLIDLQHVEDNLAVVEQLVQSTVCELSFAQAGRKMVAR